MLLLSDLCRAHKSKCRKNLWSQPAGTHSTIYPLIPLHTSWTSCKPTCLVEPISQAMVNSRDGRQQTKGYHSTCTQTYMPGCKHTRSTYKHRVSALVLPVCYPRCSNPKVTTRYLAMHADSKRGRERERGRGRDTDISTNLLTDAQPKRHDRNSLQHTLTKATCLPSSRPASDGEHLMSRKDAE